MRGWKIEPVADIRRGIRRLHYRSTAEPSAYPSSSNPIQQRPLCHSRSRTYDSLCRPGADWLWVGVADGNARSLRAITFKWWRLLPRLALKSDLKPRKVFDKFGDWPSSEGRCARMGREDDLITSA